MEYTNCESDYEIYDLIKNDVNYILEFWNNSFTDFIGTINKMLVTHYYRSIENLVFFVFREINLYFYVFLFMKII